MSDSRPKKSFFEHTDYRELLKDLYIQNKSENKNFSFRFFARLAGFKSAAFLKRVIDGESKLSEESILKIAKGFKMSRDETHFFRNLVLLNQATSVEERQAPALEILRSRAYKKIHPLSESQYNFYSKWFYIPIRELVSLPGFKEDYEWIASQIRPAIKPEEAKTAIEELVKLELLNRNDSKQLVYSKTYLATPAEVASVSVAQWHREMMKRAAESIDTVPRNERHLEGMTLRIAQEDLPMVKDMVQKFRQDLVDVLSKTSPNSVYQLNFHFFPLSHPQGEEHEKK